MAKTLVIKGADFSANKLATVAFDSIPCTGISVSPSSVTATTDDPVTITATLTPANTTDTLSWSSSDSTVVTVANGVLTIVGNGTATVTATCGNQTATVSVTVNMQKIANPKWEWVTSNVASGLTTYTPSTSLKYITAFGQGTEASAHIVSNTTSPDVSSPYAIKLPTGATKVKVSASVKSGLYDGTGSRICWANDAGSSNFIVGVERVDFNDTGVPLEFTAPSGADSFILTMRFTDAQSYESADACAEHYGFQIEFLTA